MKQSQFDAKTFGLGELISQRKLFRVPRHQRSFSWNPDSVESLLSDIQTAFKGGASEYFVGLIVIQGPTDGEWTLLDGQQRLTTISLLYSAMRNWLRQNAFEDDAKQIESEFLMVRRLGGDFSSRMLLNKDNGELFESIVLGHLTGPTLQERAKSLPKRTSNRYLAEAAVNCEKWVNLFCSEIGSAKASQSLYQLSSFVETRVKAVSVEVSSDVDAYILFEALNDRGVELSAFDLLKNYLYSKISEPKILTLETEWKQTVDNLDEMNPDDFLKVFWTSRYGIIQKALLFKALRERYSDQGAAIALINDLRQDSALIGAVDDPRNPFWNDFPDQVRSHVAVLSILGSKQARPVILAAIHHLTMPLFGIVLWHLIVAIIRYQIIGRGRTGVVERVFGRLCRSIADGSIDSEGNLIRVFDELHVSDDDFLEGFCFHSESKPSRYFYFLWELERQLQENPNSSDFNLSVEDLTEHYGLLSLLSPEELTKEERVSGLHSRIGNYLLVHRHNLFDMRHLAQNQKNEFAIKNSTLPSLNRFGAQELIASVDTKEFVEKRSRLLADAASSVWTHAPVAAKY